MNNDAYICITVSNKAYMLNALKAMKTSLRITFKSVVNANGLKGIVINPYRIKKAFVLIKEFDLRNALYFFDAGFTFNEDN